MNETVSMDSQTGKDHWGRMDEKDLFRSIFWGRMNETVSMDSQTGIKSLGANG